MRSAAILCQERKNKIKTPAPPNFLFQTIYVRFMFVCFLNTQDNF